MGSGKSSAAITYMNEHSDDKFIYITPYLEEAGRIKEQCPALCFVEPSSDRYEFRHSKILHTIGLIHDGENITTTHQAFKRYSKEMLDDIKKQGYTLILDENISMLDKTKLKTTDFNLMLDQGWILENDGVCSSNKTKLYDGAIFENIFNILNSRNLIRVKDENESEFFYWIMPPEFLSAFKEVFILTYLFKGQTLYYFTEINGLKFDYIGVKRTNDGTYRFCENTEYTPDYVKSLKDKINILNRESLNRIGDDRCALSMNWFKKGGERLNKLKRNIYNVFKNVWGDSPVNERLWGGYKIGYQKIKGKGYTKAFLSFNARATNKYRNRKYLAYTANVFMNTNERRLYNKFGIEVDEDMYALSFMLQWIWRSAIRDGKEIYIYVPSSRMRNLLTEWIENVSKQRGGEI